MSLRSRIIPALLLDDGKLIKTIKFTEPKYVGDPINVVRIFNEKKVDEILILDIYASSRNEKPDFELIKSLARECRMPFCYGGGINSVKDAEKIISFGVEKVALGSAAVNNPEILTKISEKIGIQSLAVIIDIKKEKNEYKIYTQNGIKRTDLNFKKFIKLISNYGVGEIIINNIDKDGTMLGYDLQIFEEIKNIITTPFTMLGGAKDIDDISKLIKSAHPVGAAAGSLFVFKGKFRAVLVSYIDNLKKYKITKP
jgi:cyclase